jgi:hypothetical protein
MTGQAVTSRYVEEEVLPGDLDAGDVIMLSGAGHELLVKAVRMGQGGYILTVTPIAICPRGALRGARKFLSGAGCGGQPRRADWRTGPVAPASQGLSGMPAKSSISRSDDDTPGVEQLITLTATTHLRKRR